MRLATSPYYSQNPSIDLHKKHLALETEDYPFEYAHLEVIIPNKKYRVGKGTLWDRLSFTMITSETLWLGTKKEKFYVYYKRKSLQIKIKDSYAVEGSSITGELTKSIISGKTIEELE